MTPAFQFLLSNTSGYLRVFLLVMLLGSLANADTFSVTDTSSNSADPNSLPGALTLANVTPGPNTITFTIAAGAQTIPLTMALPGVTNSVTFDGTSQPGYSGTPLIQIQTTAGSPVFVVTGANVAFLGLNILSEQGTNNNGTNGSSGGTGGVGTIGGNGISINGSGSFSDSQSLISGGTGGSGNGGSANQAFNSAGAGNTGGAGGTGLILAGNGSPWTNNGQISGGMGGAALGGVANGTLVVGGQGGNGGAGGSAVILTVNGITFANGSLIFGGAGGAGDGGQGNGAGVTGGNGGTGGIGGDGIDGMGNSATLTNSGTITGGVGGSVNGGNASGAGGTGGDSGTGGAGGAGYNISGSATSSTNSNTVTGGAGGTANGGTGSGAGAIAGNGGIGGAGGAGYNISGSATSSTNSNTVTGGTGGTANGGTGSGAGTIAGNGGTGGTGGAGYNISGATTLTNDGAITGGAGGSANGNNAIGGGLVGGNGGVGGTGGAGLAISASGVTVTNSGTIMGGNGGVASGGTGFTTGTNGTGGSGGAAISFTVGSGSVTNGGTITGGLANGGAGAQADAIDFSGSNNQLQLLSGSVITGNVVVKSPGSNNALVLGGTTNGTFDVSSIGVQYQGFDTEQKIGTSTWTLTGSTAAVTSWTVSAGVLVVSNSAALGAGNVTVNGGTLSTDNVNHLITVKGDYTQGAGGTLLLNITSPTVYDTMNLTSGTAHLNGTLKLNLVGSFAPGAGQTFALITTNNPINGKFSTVTTNLPSIGSMIDYTNDVTVLYQNPFVNLAGFNLNPNQRSIATYIDTYDQHITNPAFANLIGALNNASGTPATLQNAFNQLSPLNFGNFAFSTAFNGTSFSMQQFDTYLANHRGANGTFASSAGGIDYSGLAINDSNVDPGLQSIHSSLLAWSPAPSTGLLSDSASLVTGGMDMQNVSGNIPDSNRWNVFVNGNVVLAQDFSNASAGIPYAHATTGATQVGADYKITKHFLVGAAFGYGHTHATVDNIGSNATVNTYSPGVYASFTSNGWFANMLGSYGFANYSQNRNVNIGAFTGTATSSPGGDQIVGNLDGGYEFHKANWTFGPTLGLGYTHLNVDGYSETGLPGADLTVASQQADSLRSRLGVAVSYAVKSGSLLFTPHMSASWQHEFFNQSRGITSQFNSVGAGSFVVATANPSKESALADLGLDAQLNNTFTLFTDYSVQAGQSNYFGQSVQAGVKIGF